MTNRSGYESGMVLPTELRIREFWVALTILSIVGLSGNVNTISLVAGAIGLGLTFDSMCDGVALNHFLKINPSEY